MTVQIIAYDLQRSGQNYTDVLNYIKQHSWARLSESAYAIESNNSAETVRDNVKLFLDSNDQVYVVTLSSDWAGWGPQDANNWMAQRL